MQTRLWQLTPRVMKAQLLTPLQQHSTEEHSSTTTTASNGRQTKKTEQKSEEETKSEEGPLVQKSDKEAMLGMMEENEASRKMIESMSEGSEVDMEEKMRFCLTQFQKLLGWSKEQMEQLGRRIRRTVE